MNQSSFKRKVDRGRLFMAKNHQEAPISLPPIFFPRGQRDHFTWSLIKPVPPGHLYLIYDYRILQTGW